MKREAVPHVVLIAIAPGDFLALSKDQLEEARALAQRMLPRDGETASELPLAEPLMTAEEMEKRTAIPASWFLEQARKDAIPHVRLGKYVRFRLSEVHAAGLRRHKAS